jgi:hypothetical protein
MAPATNGMGKLGRMHLDCAWQQGNGIETGEEMSAKEGNNMKHSQRIFEPQQARE